MTGFKWLVVNLIGTFIIGGISVYFQATESTTTAIVIFLAALVFYVFTNKKMIQAQNEE